MFGELILLLVNAVLLIVEEALMRFGRCLALEMAGQRLRGSMEFA